MKNRAVLLIFAALFSACIAAPGMHQLFCRY